jgi:hypothetical protein
VTQFTTTALTKLVTARHRATRLPPKPGPIQGPNHSPHIRL